MKLEIENLSNRYSVLRMTEADAERILALCRTNPQYYEFCGRQTSLEEVKSDLRVTPPGKTREDKYYVGFEDGGALAAVMDLIAGYPDEQTAFIGFFMLDSARQGRGAGSALIGEVCGYLRTAGFEKVRLGIDKNNPQARHFWMKNCFRVIREVQRDADTILLAERVL